MKFFFLFFKGRGSQQIKIKILPFAPHVKIKQVKVKQLNNSGGNPNVICGRGPLPLQSSEPLPLPHYHSQNFYINTVKLQQLKRPTLTLDGSPR